MSNAEKAEIKDTAGLLPAEGRPVPTTLPAAEVKLSNAVYAATRLLEDLEHRGLVRGNGHHLRQQVATYAVELLRGRWEGEKG